MNEKIVLLEALITADTTNTMNKVEFRSFLGLLIEEYCKSNNADPKEIATDLKADIGGINDKYGKYGG